MEFFERQYRRQNNNNPRQLVSVRRSVRAIHVHPCNTTAGLRARPTRFPYNIRTCVYERAVRWI